MYYANVSLAYRHKNGCLPKVALPRYFYHHNIQSVTLKEKKSTQSPLVLKRGRGTTKGNLMRMGEAYPFAKSCWPEACRGCAWWSHASFEDVEM